MAKWWISFLLLISVKVSAVELSCECPKLGCDPCSRERGVTFFSEKCGPHDSKTKSCARPTCIPVDSPTEACPNPPKSAQAREPVVIEEVAKVDPNADVSRPQVGKVKVIKGSVAILDAEGKKVLLKEAGDIRETDTLVAEADGAAVVEFQGGNKMHVHPDTAVEVKDFKNQDQPNARKVFLNLVRGKIRNQVKQKYNGKTSSYQVKTQAAVAGVRGTDFIVEHSSGDMLETRVESLDGRVTLGDLAQKELRQIKRGEGATYTISAAALKAKSGAAEFVEGGGKLSPVYTISPEKLRELEMDSRVDVARAPKPKKVAEKEICSSPKGFFNQCSWKNAGGKCLRQRCNANGKWSEDTVVPAVGGCPVGVAPCDY